MQVIANCEVLLVPITFVTASHTLNCDTRLSLSLVGSRTWRLITALDAYTSIIIVRLQTPQGGSRAKSNTVTGGHVLTFLDNCFGYQQTRMSM